MAAEWLKIGEDPNSKIIEKAAAFIRQAKVVVLPTETVYGLAVRRDSKACVERLYEIKNRPYHKPFTLHIADAKSFFYLAQPQEPYVYRLVEKFWPGPLTLIVKTKDQSRLGIRNPNFSLTQQIIRKSGCEVVMPSANLSGQPPAKSALAVWQEFAQKVDLIVTAPYDLAGISSTIVDAVAHKIIRRGLDAEEIEKEMQEKRVLFVCSGNTCRSVMAEYLLRDYLAKKRPDIKDKVEVISAGVFAIDKAPASPLAQAVLKQVGIDAKSHLSRRLSPLLIKGADLIIVMEERQKNIILSLEQDIALRLFHINYFLSDKIDIYDPIAGGKQAYESVFAVIKKAVENIGKKL